ncbi:MAG TPA: translation elongation factor 4 [Candidatus Paceibacterota bacterium]|nr:translation elongation factor 4 [Candidatus Paceibacterota bacterium]
MASRIRNFSIIAHIDHGKSTLSDRMLERTGTIEERQMRAQVLDSMDLERERGITIKMQPVRMQYRPAGSGDEYILNLIDTPGHVDFSYEVSRALKAVEGAILLVDATQGVEAQTLSVLDSARKAGLAIIPALSKVDAPAARVDDVRFEVAELLGCDMDDVYLTSGKTGEGVTELLDAIIEKVPAPADHAEKPLSALVFDFDYSDHRGVIVYARIMEGTLKARQDLSFCSAKASFSGNEIGVLTPKETPAQMLSAGEIGYITTGIKKPGVVSVGDTIIRTGSNAAALPGYQKPAPVIWASIYPEEATSSKSGDAFTDLKQAIERLALTDSSLTWEEEQSGVLGRGFRCGFLGMLHLEIVTERLRREFGLSLITTTPSVAYTVRENGHADRQVYTPAQFPDADAQRYTVLEPWVGLDILVPPALVGAVLPLLVAHEAVVGDTEQTLGERVKVHAEMPLRELMRNFFDKMTSATSGYASVSYEFIEERPADVVRLDILVAEEAVPALTRVVSARRAEEEGRATVEKLKEILPAQLIVLKIQARAKGRIIASERIAARRKDVTGYLYGGDITRKMKLLEKQKKGKKKMQERAQVHIPQEVFLKMMREQ